MSWAGVYRFSELVLSSAVVCIMLEIFVLARTVYLDSVAEGLHSSGEATCEVRFKTRSLWLIGASGLKNNQTAAFTGKSWDAGESENGGSA